MCMYICVCIAEDVAHAAAEDVGLVHAEEDLGHLGWGGVA